MVDASCDESVNLVRFRRIFPRLFFFRSSAFVFVAQVMRLGILPDTRHASEVKSQVFNGERLGQAEDQGPLQMSTGRLMFVATKDNVIIVQTGRCVRAAVQQHRITRCRVPHSPDIEILGVACAPAATKEAESHFSEMPATIGRAMRGRSSRSEG
jgi:hypothetical protein